jgi:Leucine-rich repeat (LRR) protein
MGNPVTKPEPQKERSLECSGQKFTVLPPFISKYEHLESVVFNNNNLTSVNGIIALTNLKQLAITHNLLTTLDDEFFFLRKLEKVLRKQIIHSFLSNLFHLFLCV